VAAGALPDGAMADGACRMATRALGRRDLAVIGNNGAFAAAVSAR